MAGTKERPPVINKSSCNAGPEMVVNRPPVISETSCNTGPGQPWTAHPLSARAAAMRDRGLPWTGHPSSVIPAAMRDWGRPWTGHLSSVRQAAMRDRKWPWEVQKGSSDKLCDSYTNLNTLYTRYLLHRGPRDWPPAVAALQRGRSPSPRPPPGRCCRSARSRLTQQHSPAVGTDCCRPPARQQWADTKAGGPCGAGGRRWTGQAWGWWAPRTHWLPSLLHCTAQTPPFRKRSKQIFTAAEI